MGLKHAQFRFPFVDLLGDGHSHFSYLPSSFMSIHPTAVIGYNLFGETIVLSTFQPFKDPYAFVSAGEVKEAGEYRFNAYQDDVSVLNTTFAPKPMPRYHMSPDPISLSVLYSSNYHQ